MRISKSRYLLGLQCPQQLWNVVNRPDRVPGPDATTERIFAQGHAIGDIAKQRYPGGYEIRFGQLAGTVRRTKDALSGGIPLFEASFARDDAYCRVDVLVPREGAWDIVEVKSGTRVKDVNVEDVAFQRWVVSKTVPVGRSYLMHVDSSYVRDGEIDPAGILTIEDVTDDTRAIEPLVAARVAEMSAMIDGAEPDVPIGSQCHAPYTCPLIDHCWAEVPEGSVFELYRGKRAEAFERYHAGERRIVDIPDADLDERQRVQKRAIETGEARIDREALSAWLASLEEPITCLDFETASSAIPIADGMRPYEQIPFQLSAHVIDGGVEHHELLSEELDPRRAVAEALLDLPERGTVLAHNASFERRVIRDLAERYPDLRGRLRALLERVDDLATPFQRFWYYRAAQHGSCSMKAIVPALGIADYAELTIGSGDIAAMSWERLVFEDLDERERETLRRDLLRYCALDTWGMVEILDRLREAADSPPNVDDTTGPTVK